MAAAIGVELVGGGGLLGTLVEIAEVLGPFLIAGAAAFAARTARKSAFERQREQLGHDSERQEKVLARDRERQQEELAHDREMRERESSREIISEAMEAVNKAIGDFHDLQMAVIRYQAAFDNEQQDGGLRQAALTAAAPCLEDQMTLTFHNARLRTRPNTDSVTNAYKEVRENFDVRRRLLVEGASGTKFTDAEKDEVPTLDDAGTKLIGSLYVTWRKWHEA
jgi:hypothetical protein